MAEFARVSTSNNQLMPIVEFGERPRVVLSQTLLVIAMITLPLFYTLVPPLEDYPNHLARMFVLANLSSNETLAHFYQAAWAPIPNLIMDIVVPPLAGLFNVYVAGRIFIGLTLLLMLLGPMLLHRALYRHWSAWPLVGGLFVYNGFLFVGLMNYLFGIGVAVFGLASWIAMAQKPALARIVVSLCVCAILYVCHLVALGMYGLAIASFEIWRLKAEGKLRWPQLFANGLILGLPFLPFLFILTRSPTWQLASNNVWESKGKLDAIETFLTVYSDLTDLPLLVLIVVAIVMAVRRRLLRFHPAGAIVLAVLSVAFFVMPRQAFGSWLADQRMVVGIFFLTLGFVSIDLHKLKMQNFFFVICLSAIAFRMVDVAVNWADISEPLREMRSAMHSIPRGSHLLVTQVDNMPEGAVESALSHAPNIALIERSALVSRLFVVPGKQILHASPDIAAHVDVEDADTPTISQVIVAEQAEPTDSPHYWNNWPQFYDYLIVLGTDPDESVNPDPDLLQIVHTGQGFDLYRIKHS